MRSAMKSQFQSLDVVVRRVVLDRIPHVFPPEMGQQTHFDPPVPEPDMDVEVAPTVPDAQSAPNEVVGDACRTHDVMADPPHEISLTQNHPSKYLPHRYWELTPFLTSIFLILFSYFYLCCRRHS